MVKQIFEIETNGGLSVDEIEDYVKSDNHFFFEFKIREIKINTGVSRMKSCKFNKKRVGSD